MPKSSSPLSPEQLLLDFSPEIREITESLRQLVKETIPDATETAYEGWRGIGYRHSSAGYFAALFPQADLVNLGFEWGALLPDPNGLLEGSGKQVRYVRIRGPSDLPISALKELLIAAVALPDNRSIKLSMLNSRR